MAKPTPARVSARVSDEADVFRQRLRKLRRDRQHRKQPRELRAGRGLRQRDRDLILQKTGGLCHVCGGPIEGTWQADHVLAHAGGGLSRHDNYLAAHALCNNYRWDYLPEEFQTILKLGVWARTQIERGTGVGNQILIGYVGHEARRKRRGGQV